MRVSHVAGRHHQGVNLQDFGPLGPGGRRHRVNPYPEWAVWTVRFDLRHLATGENTVLPFPFVGILDFLDVHIMVDLFDQLEPDDAVVGRSIGGNIVATLIG